MKVPTAALVIQGHRKRTTVRRPQPRLRDGSCAVQHIKKGSADAIPDGQDAMAGPARSGVEQVPALATRQGGTTSALPSSSTGGQVAPEVPVPTR